MATSGVERIVERQMRNWELARGQRDTESGPLADGVFEFVAISRQSGSGGLTLARGVGEQTGWDVYDREILNYMAQDDAVQQKIYEMADERVEAHIFVATLALFLKRSLEHQLAAPLPELSSTDALAAMKSIGNAELSLNGRTTRLVSGGGRDARRDGARATRADASQPDAAPLHQGGRAHKLPDQAGGPERARRRRLPPPSLVKVRPNRAHGTSGLRADQALLERFGRRGLRYPRGVAGGIEIATRTGYCAQVESSSSVHFWRQT